METPSSEQLGITKPKRFSCRRVTLMPNLRGVRVIQGENGCENLVGKQIPWYRVHFQSHQGGTTTHLLDARGQPMKLDGSRVSAYVKNRANAAQRAQQRHILAWVRSSNEPIRFVPKAASIWGIVILSAMMVPAFVFLYVQAISQFQHFPPQSNADWFAVIQLLILSLAASFMGWFMITYRPRKLLFGPIDLLPSGFVGTLLTGEIMSVEFDEHSKPRLRRGDPLRLEFTAGDGQRMSFAVPKPVSTYLRTALNPPMVSQAQSRRSESKRYFWLGIRIIVAGILCTIGSYYLIAWLGQLGWILPQDVISLQQRIPFLTGYPAIAGFLMIFLSWKYSDHGIRTRSRLARRFARSANRTKQAATEPNAKS